MVRGAYCVLNCFGMSGRGMKRDEEDEDVDAGLAKWEA